MAFRKLIEPDCGQENALTQLGQHFTHDIANTEKIHFAPMDFQNRQSHSADQLVQEFMQVSEFNTFANHQCYHFFK